MILTTNVQLFMLLDGSEAVTIMTFALSEKHVPLGGTDVIVTSWPLLSLKNGTCQVTSTHCSPGNRV